MSDSTKVPAMNGKPEDQEPSMDDILASIRRIMLDEQARLKEGAPATAEVTAEPEAEALPVLLLDDSMAVPEPAPVAPPAAESEAEPEAARESAPEPPAEEPAVAVTQLETIVVQPEPAPMPEAAAETRGEDEGGSEGESEKPAATAPALSLAGLDAQTIEALLAPAAAAAASASVEAMLHQLQAERAAFTSAAGPSLEEVVRAELRPLLKSWLDANLAEMVERLVRAELSRLALRHGG